MEKRPEYKVDERKRYVVEPGHFELVPLNRWGKLTWFPYMVVVALLALVSGLLSLLVPDLSLLTIQRPEWTVQLVGGTYVASGLLILHGLKAPSISTEILGQVLLLTGVVAEIVADYVYHDPELLQTNLSFLIVLLGASLRIRLLLGPKRMVLVRVTDEEE